MIWPVLSIACGVVFLVAFAWPWVTPILDRHDAIPRLLDRLEEEWERDEAPPREPWNW